MEPVYFVISRVDNANRNIIYTPMKILEGTSDELNTVYNENRSLIYDSGHQVSIMMFARTRQITDVMPAAPAKGVEPVFEKPACSIVGCAESPPVVRFIFKDGTAGMYCDYHEQWVLAAVDSHQMQPIINTVRIL